VGVPNAVRAVGSRRAAAEPRERAVGCANAQGRCWRAFCLRRCGCARALTRAVCTAVLAQRIMPFSATFSAAAPASERLRPRSVAGKLGRNTRRRTAHATACFRGRARPRRPRTHSRTHNTRTHTYTHRCNLTDSYSMLEPFVYLEDQVMSAPAFDAFILCRIGEIWSVLSPICAHRTHTHATTTGLHENDRSCVSAVCSSPFGIIGPDL
jgi:hypothetical protein